MPFHRQGDTPLPEREEEAALRVQRQQNNEEGAGTLAIVREKWDNDKAAQDNQTNIP